MKPNRRSVVAGLAAAGAAGLAGAFAMRVGSRRPPNLVLILTDDQGYNDLGCYFTAPGDDAYGSIHTPQLDIMAAEGVRLTDFYVAASICTPSRAALLTGCYPPRVGFGRKDSGIGVLSPKSDAGLAAPEVTIAEVLKDAGYRTACVGKWHLGHRPPFIPTRQGFDTFYGIPWSNNQRPLPLVLDEETVRALPARPVLVKQFTRAALTFIADNADRPFFLYLAYSAPHEPWAVQPDDRGRSPRGLYGDVIETVDDNVGELLAALRDHGLEQDTLVVFTSDNGPWLDHPYPTSGSAHPLRGGKASMWEGGFRSPCLWWWPDTLPAGTVCSEVVTALDIMPTFATLAGADVPTDRGIDGHDVWPVLRDGAPSPTEAFFYYSRGRLEAVRWRHYKRVYDVPQRNPAIGAALYDLQADVSETTDVSAQHPEVVTRIDVIADEMRERLGDVLRDKRGSEARPAGLWTG